MLFFFCVGRGLHDESLMSILLLKGFWWMGTQGFIFAERLSFNQICRVDMYYSWQACILAIVWKTWIFLSKSKAKQIHTANILFVMVWWWLWWRWWWWWWWCWWRWWWWWWWRWWWWWCDGVSRNIAKWSLSSTDRQSNNREGGVAYTLTLLRSWLTANWILECKPVSQDSEHLEA